METLVLQEDFQKGLNIASRFISPRPQLPILSHVLLNAKSGQLQIIGTNLEFGINIKLGANVKTPGQTTISSHTLNEVISNLTPGRIKLMEKNGTLTISSNASSVNLPTTPHNDFPSLPKELSKEKIKLPLKLFKDIAKQIIFAVGNDSSKQEFSGILFLPKEDNFEIVATDGVRLSRKIIEAKFKINEKLLIPFFVLSEIPKIFTEDYLEFSINEGENQVLFGNDKALLVARLINGDFPDFEKIIPKGWETRITVEKEELLKAIGLASVFAEDYKVELTTQKNSLVVSSEHPQLGSQTSTLPIKLEGEEIVVAFNCRYLKDFLNAVEGVEVIIELASAIAPGVFRDPKDESFLHLIMPIRIVEK